MANVVFDTRERVRVAKALLLAWETGCHDDWKDPIVGHAFDELLQRGLMEEKENETPPRRRLTPKGVRALIYILDALAVSL